MSFQEKPSAQNREERKAAIQKGWERLIEAVYHPSQRKLRERDAKRSLSESLEIKELNCPQYVIGFPDKDNPHTPHYHIEGQAEEWVPAPRNGHFYYDPIEDSAEFKNIIDNVELLVDQEMGENRRYMGACHRAWAIKKRILKEHYGIEWHSAADLNPSCRFD